MATIFSNFKGGVVSDNPLTSGATTVNSTALGDLDTVASPDAMWMVLDPEGANGDPEIVRVTTHTAAATSATITRAQQGTTARSHPQNTAWVIAATKFDLEQLPFRLVTAKGDLIVGTDANSVDNLAVGSNALPLVAKSSATEGMAWEALAAGGLASNAVTTAKILDANVTTAKIADDAVTTDKINAAAVTATELASDAVTTAKILAANVTTAKIADANVTTGKLADEAVTTAKIDSAARRGEVAYKEKEDGNQTNITTSTVITDVNPSFTADSTVKYKVTVEVPHIDLVPGVDETVAFALWGATNGGADDAYRTFHQEVSTGGLTGAHFERRFDAGDLVGATDFYIRIAPVGGNRIDVLADQTYNRPSILVEAIGEA